MKQQISTKIHNRFDIESRNIETGEITKYYAENIVLDQIYPRLCSGSSYFVNIHFGTGSGVLAPTRTSLFTHLGTKAAVNDAQSKVLPTSYWRQKIVLNPEEYVGSVLTEVGISYDATSTHLETHAMIRDMNGNIVTLTKTALDVLTIYATVYVTFNTTNANLVISGLPSNNPLINYLIGGAVWSSGFSFFTGLSPAAGGPKSMAVNSTVVGTSASITWTADNANRKMKTNSVRFQVGDSNGDIAEIGLGLYSYSPIFRLQLPAAGIYPGLDLTGVSVGTGDGVTKEFMLPSKNVKQDSVVMKLDGVVASEYTKSLINNMYNFRYQSLRSPDQPGGGACAVAISDDGKVMAVVDDSGSTSPYLRTYDLVDGFWVGRPTPAVAPTSGARNCKLSADGKVLVVTASSSPVLYTYDWDGSAWIKRPNPAVAASGGGYLSISGDGNRILMSYDTSPYYAFYDWDGSAWIKIANPVDALPGSPQSLVLSEDGKVAVLTCTAAPFVWTYDWNGTAWIKRPATAGMLPGFPSSYISISSNGNVLAINYAYSPRIYTFDWSGSAWVKRPDPAVLPNNNGPVALNSDGTILVVGSSSYALIYEWINGAWIAKTGSNPSFSYPPNACWISRNANIVAFVGQGFCLYVYNYDPLQTKITFNTPPANGAVITADYTVNGIHKTIQRVIDLSAEIVFGEVV